MSEQLASAAGAPTERLLRLYERFAVSGAGLLLTGNVMIDRRQLGEPYNVVLEDPRHQESLRGWAATGKAHGARVWMQLNHPGRQVPRMLSDHPLAPSAVPLNIKGFLFARPRAMNDDDIHEALVRFGRSAKLAQDAGFDGVQIHGAHGYLINQFLSPLTNRREDRWGGSLANRMRFALEAVHEVRRAVGDAFPIGFKLSSSDFLRGGFDTDEALEVATALDTVGVDLIEVSGGTYESTAMLGLARGVDRSREAYFGGFARAMKRRVDAAVMLTGGNRSRSGVSDAVATRECDLVGFARPMALVPDIPRRLLGGEELPPLPRPRRVPVRSVEAFSRAMWHERQLRRMSGGDDPSRHLSTLVSIAWGARRNTIGAARVRRQRQLDGVV